MSSAIYLQPASDRPRVRVDVTETATLGRQHRHNADLGLLETDLSRTILNLHVAEHTFTARGEQRTEDVLWVTPLTTRCKVLVNGVTIPHGQSEPITEQPVKLEIRGSRTTWRAAAHIVIGDDRPPLDSLAHEITDLAPTHRDYGLTELQAAVAAYRFGPMITGEAAEPVPQKQVGALLGYADHSVVNRTLKQIAKLVDQAGGAELAVGTGAGLGVQLHADEIITAVKIATVRVKLSDGRFREFEL